MTTLTLTMTVILSPKPYSYMFYDLPIEPQLTTMSSTMVLEEHFRFKLSHGIIWMNLKDLIMLSESSQHQRTNTGIPYIGGTALT